MDKVFFLMICSTFDSSDLAMSPMNISNSSGDASLENNKQVCSVFLNQIPEQLSSSVPFYILEAFPLSYPETGSNCKCKRIPKKIGNFVLFSMLQINASFSSGLLNLFCLLNECHFYPVTTP